MLLVFIYCIFSGTSVTCGEMHCGIIPSRFPAFVHASLRSYMLPCVRTCRPASVWLEFSDAAVEGVAQQRWFNAKCQCVDTFSRVQQQCGSFVRFLPRKDIVGRLMPPLLV